MNLAEGESMPREGGGESLLSGGPGEGGPDALDAAEWVIASFTDPRSGETYDIIDGRMIISLTDTPQQPVMDPNYFDVEHLLYDPQYQVSAHPMLGDPAVSAFIAAEQLQVFAAWPEIGALGVVLPPEQTVLDAVVRWPAQYPAVVLAADPDEYVSAPTGDWDPPNDHEFYSQWSVNDTYALPGVRHINVHQAWRQGYIGNDNAVVALIDTGTEWGIPDLDANSTLKGCNTGSSPQATRFNWRSQEGGGETWTWVKNLNSQTAKEIGHGTCTASIMASRGGNDNTPNIPDGKELVGVGPQIKFFPVAALFKASAAKPKGGYDEAAIINALYAVGAVKGVYKPNGTFQAGVYAPYHNIEVMAFEAGAKQWNTALYTIIAQLQRYILIVCAAGNSGNHVQNEFPARLSSMIGMTGVMSVAAHNMYGYRTANEVESSCYAPDTSIVAPGTAIIALDILGTNSSGAELGYQSDALGSIWAFSGTSAAVPHVAGVATLINCYFTTLTPAGIRSRIIVNSSGGLQNWPGETGFDSLRRLNALGAITQ
jgi:hypothetical protein